MQQSDRQSHVKTGLICGLTAYGLWGLVPVYFKNVAAAPPSEILAHRVVWSVLLLGTWLAIAGKFGEYRACFRSRKAMKFLGASSFFIAINWYFFIYGVSTNRITQTSLGYFLLPLTNVVIGVILGEKMRRAQWVAVGVVVFGVGFMVYGLGVFPWLSITLAVTFSLYGVCRKFAPVGGAMGLTVETTVLLPLALAYWVYLILSPQGLAFLSQGWELDALLVFSGVVTTVPLVLFAMAIRRLQLVTIGFIQYASPSLAMMIGVLRYGEEFQTIHLISYGFIWCGVALFLRDAYLHTRQQKENALKATEEAIDPPEVGDPNEEPLSAHPKPTLAPGR